MSTSERTTYHHGNLRPALIAAARALLDEGGANAVGLREAARRVGVSPTATYRHFRDKDDLLAAVAAEGFREFGAALAAAGREGDPLSAMGAAYVDFALARPGMFRLMFSPLMAKRELYPELVAASDDALALLRRGVASRAAAGEGQGEGVDAAAIAAWSLVHGLSHLILDGVLPKESAEAFKQAILTPPKGAPDLGRFTAPKR
ncbi:MAG: TetR/AcrR family transcriptional regulator [Roseiarcus sp.]|jgi:AcrR family transcriptional regulator